MGPAAFRGQGSAPETLGLSILKQAPGLRLGVSCQAEAVVHVCPAHRGAGLGGTTAPLGRGCSAPTIAGERLAERCGNGHDSLRPSVARSTLWATPHWVSHSELRTEEHSWPFRFPQVSSDQGWGQGVRFQSQPVGQNPSKVQIGQHLF